MMMKRERKGENKKEKKENLNQKRKVG